MIVVKCVLFLLLTQVTILSCNGRSVDEVVQSFSVVIAKLYEEIGNFSKDVYRRSSEKVNYIIQNNTNEIIKTMDLIPQMQNNATHLLSESGMNYYPQLVKECKYSFNKNRDILVRKATETENICIVFIANVFSLMENPSLYKNISDVRLLTEEVEANCTNKIVDREAQECFTHKIYGFVKPRIKELKRKALLFYDAINRNATSMTSVLYNCYSTIRHDLLLKLINNALYDFERCIHSKNRNAST